MRVLSEHLIFFYEKRLRHVFSLCICCVISCFARQRRVVRTQSFPMAAGEGGLCLPGRGKGGYVATLLLSAPPPPPPCAGQEGSSCTHNRSLISRSLKMVQSAEGGEGKNKRERIIVVVRSPCQENDAADAHPSAHKSVLESANPAWTRSVHLDAPGQRHGQQPVYGTAAPRSSQTGQVIRGLR